MALMTPVCKIKGVTHAPALRVHSAVLERLALTPVVLIGCSVVTVSGRCSHFRLSVGPEFEPRANTTDYVTRRVVPAMPPSLRSISNSLISEGPSQD